MRKIYQKSVTVFLILIISLGNVSLFAQDPAFIRINRYTQNFNTFVIDNAQLFSETRMFEGAPRAPYTFSLEEGALRVDVDKNFTPESGNNNFVSFRYNISPDSLTVVDMIEFPYMSFKVKTSEAIPYRVQVFEANGIVNPAGAMNRAALETTIPAANEWTEIFVDLTGLFIHVTNSNLDTLFIEDPIIFQFLMVPNFGATGATWQGTVWVDDIKMGKAAAPKPRIDRYTQNFSDFVIDPAKIFSETRMFEGAPRAPYTFSLEEGALRVDVDKNFTPESGNNNFVSFRYNISTDSLTVVDMNEYPYMSFKVKTSDAIPYRVQVFEGNGIVNAGGAMNRAALETTIPAANEWTEVFVDLTGKFIHVTNSNLDTLFIEDPIIFQFLMVPNFGATGATWQGTVWVDDIKLGKAAAPKTRIDRYTQNFTDFVIDPAKLFSETRMFEGAPRAPYTFSLEEGALKVDVDKNFTPETGNNNFVSFRYNISTDSLTVVDMNEFPYMSFKVKASEAIPYRVQVFEGNGIVNAGGAMNRAALETTIPVADEWTEVFVDLTGKFIHVTNSNLDTLFIEDPIIFQFLMVPNFGATGATWQGTVWVDDIKLGKAAAPKTRIDTYTQDFEDFVLDPAKLFSETRMFEGAPRAPYTFSLEEGALKVDVDKNFTPESGNNNFVSFRYNISTDSLTVVDMIEYPYMSFKVKASEAIPYRVQVFEGNGIVNAGGAMNRAALETTIATANEWTDVFVDLTDLFIHVTNSNLDTVFIEDPIIFQFLMVPNFGATGATWQGTVWVDDIKLGKAAEPVIIEPSSNNYLSALMVDGATPEGFDKEVLSYTIVLPEGTTQVPVVTATPEDVNATVTIVAAEQLPGTTTISVLAEDGVSIREYTIIFEVETGISETINRAVMYPNPASDFVMIETTQQVVNVAIYTIDGKLTKTISGSKQIQVSDLPAGIYLFVIEFEKGNVVRRSVVRN